MFLWIFVTKVVYSMYIKQLRNYLQQKNISTWQRQAIWECIPFCLECEISWRPFRHAALSAKIKKNKKPHKKQLDLQQKKAKHSKKQGNKKKKRETNKNKRNQLNFEFVHSVTTMSKAGSHILNNTKIVPDVWEYFPQIYVPPIIDGIFSIVNSLQASGMWSFSLSR